MLSGTARPPGTPSAMFSLAVTATVPPAPSRTAATTGPGEAHPVLEWTTPRVRPLIEPGATGTS